MRILADKNIRQLFLSIVFILGFFLLLSQLVVWIFKEKCSLALLLLFLCMMAGVLVVFFWHVWKQNRIMEKAINQINAYLDGDINARIDCDSDGVMYRLFHSINTLASVLNAHAVKELETKETLKNTISDISHQLKTPLAALNIYNSLLQDEAGNFPEAGCIDESGGAACSLIATVKECTTLSERELDRIETLIQNLLKIAKLDAGFIVFEKNTENVSEMMKDIELHFAYKARQEQKKIVLSGDEEVTLFCDRDWLIEAVSNVVKNAFEHTGCGDSISIEWKAFPSLVQIIVKDHGCGIHPEDQYHIFKRFYRSRFSKETQGIGLGLPLAKAIIEAHNGTIEVDSVLGRGTAFVMDFLTPAESRKGSLITDVGNRRGNK